MNNYMKEENKCICKEQLGRETISLHLGWCPQSYFYQRDLAEYTKAPWYKKVFMTDPRKYKNYWLKY